MFLVGLLGMSMVMCTFFFDFMFEKDSTIINEIETEDFFTTKGG
jgi:hypothetical protein